MAKILLVDDDVDLNAAYEAVFTARGHEVSQAFSAEEARGLLEGLTPDAAVLDVMMETQTAGFELARDIAAAYPSVPIVLITGIHQETGVPFRFEPDGDWVPVVKILDKPVAPKDVADEVEQFLQAK